MIQKGDKITLTLQQIRDQNLSSVLAYEIGKKGYLTVIDVTPISNCILITVQEDPAMTIIYYTEYLRINSFNS